EQQAAGRIRRPQLQAAGPGQADAAIELVAAVRLDDLVEEAADLAGVAAGFRVSLLGVVQLLQDHHRHEHVVLLELEQRGRVVHQHIGVQDVDALASGHGRLGLGARAPERTVPPRLAARVGNGDVGTGDHLLRAACCSCRRASYTASAWPATLTLRHCAATRPSGSIRKVLRSMPRNLRPYSDFSRITSKPLHKASSASETRSKRKPCLAQKLACDFTESRETPSTSAPARRNFVSRALNSRPSVVQPGVESFG